MEPVKAVINEYCRKAQLRKLENLSRPYTITLEQARQQCKDVLKEAAEAENERPSNPDGRGLKRCDGS